MASSWDKLGQAASVMQVTGVDAFGLVSMIVQAAHTVRHNRDLCQQLALHVQNVGDLLRKLDIPELRRHLETRRPLEQLDAALFRAYKLVRSCSQQQEKRGKLYQMFTGEEVASKLRLAQEEIDRYISLVPMITLVAVVSAQRGTNEVHEDVMSNDAAPIRRNRLSLRQVTESLRLEELPSQDTTRNDREARRNKAWQLIENVRSGLVDQMGRYLIYGGAHKSTGTEIYVHREMDDVIDDVIQREKGPRRFSYSQLSQATRGFSDDKKLGDGEGGFGTVYRGFLQDQGLHVAIKRISMTLDQESREYIAYEVTLLSHLEHRNLVQLIGWCHKADDLLLVYELITNGSLDDHLYSTCTLAWPIRYNIILGLAYAILYIHSVGQQAVVHRNIKPSNVMLDSSLNAKLGDFGLDCLFDPICAAQTMMLAGTKVYMDPEFVVTGRANYQSDIYSFGVLLLEIACGRKPVVPQDRGKVLLMHWVWDLHGRGQVLDAGDTRLHGDDGELNALEMERVLVVGLWCVHPDCESRPSIWQAMKVLQFEAPLPELPLHMPVATYRPLVP